MTLWVDAQLSPRIATWLSANFGISASPLRKLGLRDAEDVDIFEAARKAGAVVLTKDSDFVELQQRLGAPPKIIWLTCGNTSDLELQRIFTKHFVTARQMLDGGDVLVEVTG